MLARLLIIALVPVILSSCAAALLSDAGAQVRTVTDEQKDCCCDFISLVVTSEGLGIGMGPGKATESAMNKARNEVAALGGNAMRVISIETTGDTYHGGGTSVVVEALKCDFERIRGK